MKCLKSSRSAHFCWKPPAFPRDATDHQHNNLGCRKTNNRHHLKRINATNKWRKDPRSGSFQNFRQKSDIEQRDVALVSQHKLPHHQSCQRPWPLGKPTAEHAQVFPWGLLHLLFQEIQKAPTSCPRPPRWAGAGLCPCKTHRLLAHPLFIPVFKWDLRARAGWHTAAMKCLLRTSRSL